MTALLKNRVIVVLGAGSCGTSLVMQVLNKLGLSMSQSLMPVKTHNKPFDPTEDEEIAKVYDNLLQQIGSTRLLPISFDPLPDDLNSRIQSQLTTIFRKNMDASKTIWGFKDPFTSCMLPFWFRIFNATNTVPVFILAVRNPAHSIRSRKKHFGTPESIGELAWLVNYVEALYHCAADCYIVHYEDWFKRGEEITEAFLEYTGMDAYFKEESVAEAIRGVINETLSRSIYDDYEVQNEYVIKLYDTLINCRGLDFDRADLMNTVKECRRIIRGFRGWYRHGHELKQLEKPGKDLAKIQTKLNRKQKQVNKLEYDLEKLVLENSRLLIENTELSDEVKNHRMQSAVTPRDQARRLEYWRREAIVLKHSYSFRLGQIILNAFKLPGKNTILMPYYIVKLILYIISGRGRDELSKALESTT